MSIVPDAPAIMRLVSNVWQASSGPLPLVAVCGALSLFTTVTVSPFLTDSSVGAYGGFPGVAAPTGTVIVGPVAVVAGAALLTPAPAAPAVVSPPGGAGGGADTGGG
ncbi:MAG: hypothetical protein M3M88_04020 [Thermoproteota archaeon]|nr:hypothetical protein [Thermoproteota archaeon]